MVVKLALALGRCTGLPIPSLRGMPTEVVTKAEAKAVLEFELLLSRAAEAQASLSEETSEGLTSKEKRKSARKSIGSTRESGTQVAATDNAYRALRSLVETQCEDPNLVLCHMTKVVASDGTVEWVTEESKSRFLDPETGGAKCLIWNRNSLSDD